MFLLPLLLCPFFYWKVADLYTVAVGVGKKINGNTLHDIAGERGTVLAIKSFEKLASSLKKVKNKVCGEYEVTKVMIPGTSLSLLGG